MTGTLRIASWNIHRTKGADGRADPDRVMTALIGDVVSPVPDLLVLIEADAEGAPQRGLLDLGRLGAESGLASLHSGPALRWGPESHGFHGVVVLGGPDVRVERGALVDLPGHCPRGAVVLDLVLRDAPLRLVATHLALSQPLRVAQMRTLGQFLDRSAPRPVLLVGDLNEWRPWGGLAFSPRVLGRRLSGPAVRSFPAKRPVLPLDRVLAEAPLKVETLRAVDTKAIRAASDHLAVRAEVTCPGARTTAATRRDCRPPRARSDASGGQGSG